MGIINRLAKLNWITTVLTPLAIILMEVLWVYSWLVWFGKWPASGIDRPSLSLISLIFLIGASFLATRFLLKQKWALVWSQLSIVLCGLVAIFLVLRFEYNAGYGFFDGQWFVYISRKILIGFSALQSLALAFLVGIFLWWRGIKWGRSRFYFEDIYHSFLFGLFALVLLVIIWGVSLGTGSLSGLTSSTGIYVAGFFFFGLSALALGNLRAIQERLSSSEGAGPFLGRRWISIMLGVIGAIIIVGIGLATIFSDDVVTALGQALGTVADWLYKGLYYLLIPLSYITYVIQFVMRLIIRLLMSGEPVEPTEFDFFEPAEQAEQVMSQGLPPAVILAIKWTVFAIIIGLVLFLLTKAVRRIMSFREYKDIEQIDESLWSWQGFKADLRLFFSLLAKRFKRTRKMPAASPYEAEETEGMLNIREIYQRLLRETSLLRLARQRNETPYEYAVRFSHAVPESSEYLNEITSVYVNVRYSEIAAEKKQINFANSLWRALKTILRKFQTMRSQ